MTNRDETVDVLVVGGGLAGGLVAEAAARQGKRVVVLERAAEPGGRARSQAQGEHRFNFGPHAIYRGGPMHRALVAAGVPVTGVDPSVGGAQALFADGRLDALPISLGGALRAGWFGTRDAVDFMRAAQAVKTGPRAQAPLHETSAAAWIDSLATRENARTMLAVLVRLATYGGDLHVLSADVAQQQLAAALRSGVIYVHGGWQALVDGLLARVKQAGAQVRHARAASLALGHGDGALQHRVLDAEGRGYRARDVVFACAPHVASSLVGEADAGLAAFARTAQPVTMRCVDLGLRDSRDLRFTLGVDVPFYFSPQRGVRGMAPAGAVSVHAALYLGAEAPGAGWSTRLRPGSPRAWTPPRCWTRPSIERCPISASACWCVACCLARWCTMRFRTARAEVSSAARHARRRCPESGTPVTGWAPKGTWPTRRRPRRSAWPAASQARGKAGYASHREPAVRHL
ncbi:MAG: NAD(P)-binding protein [Sandaracinaceae bacterium]|nr:NAD(P)-binding protein [Sandaracinaceae bacterium]